MSELPSRVLRIDAQKSIPSLLKAVAKHPHATVFVQIDEVAPWMRNATQLRFLKNKAEEAGKKIVVITNHQTVREIAQQSSLDVYRPHKPKPSPSSSKSQRALPKPKVLQDARKILPTNLEMRGTYGALPQRLRQSKPLSQGRHKVRSFSPLAVRGWVAGVRSFDRKEIKTYSKGCAQRIWGVGVRFMQRRNKVGMILAVTFAVCTVSIFLMVSILPHATIRFTPHTIEEQVSFNLAASTEISAIDFENNIIPSQVIEEEEHREFIISTSGEEEVAEFATGFITIYNEHSDKPQTLVEGTRFLSPEGRIFRITEQVVVPGGTVVGGNVTPSSVQAPVRADDAGDIFNIKPTSFSIPGFNGTAKYYNFYGRSDEPMTGGAKGLRSIVTEEDVQTIQQQVREELYGVVQEKLRMKIPDDFVAIEDTLRPDIKEFRMYANIGEPADKLVVNVTVRARVVLIRSEDANLLFDEYIVSEGSEYINSTYEQGGVRDIQYTLRENNYDTGLTRLSMSVQQSFRYRIDTEELFQEIAGKNSEELRTLMSGREEFTKFRVEFWPPFLMRSIPHNRDDVKFKIDYVDTVD